MPTNDPAQTIRIRDPIHGTLKLSRAEIALVDSPSYQRLRMIKQLGLADLAFPGATHTRYAHGLGTMHVASLMFDRVAREYDLDRADRLRLATTVRLAALFHDLGHAPLSHTTEAFMPSVRELGMGPWQQGADDRRAFHEDYTIKMIVDSELTERIDRWITQHCGVTAEDIASLVAGRPMDRSRFNVEGRDWLPLLRQCVSSELDADRMDYLLRDSHYAGVPYGRYDLEWLVDNLVPVDHEGAVHLGLGARATFSFEDFLLSRYHMFTSVYFHQIPIGYEVMLRRFFAERTNEFVVPSDMQSYLHCDDIYLWSALRGSKSDWARRVVERRAYRLLVETKEFHGSQPPELDHPEMDVDRLDAELAAQGIDAIVHSAKGRLSKYFRGTFARDSGIEDAAPTLYVVDGGTNVPIEQYTPLFQRYSAAVHLKRIYVDPDRLADARRILRA